MIAMTPSLDIETALSYTFAATVSRCYQVKSNRTHCETGTGAFVRPLEKLSVSGI